MSATASKDGAGSFLDVKVVPGASTSEIVGPHGDALRVRVAAPPADGRANDALRELLAARLRVPLRAVSVVRGASRPRKTLFVAGLAPAELERRLRG